VVGRIDPPRSRVPNVLSDVALRAPRNSIADCLSVGGNDLPELTLTMIEENWWSGGQTILFITIKIDTYHNTLQMKLASR
jgi:hypothetical protein